MLQKRLWLTCSCGVVVITCASHAQGPRFDPGQEQSFAVIHQTKQALGLSMS